MSLYFGIDVTLSIGKWQGEIEEYKLKSVVELWIFSHFLIDLEIFFSKKEALKSHRWEETTVFKRSRGVVVSKVSGCLWNLTYLLY